MRTLVRSLSTILITAGVLLLIDAGVTLAWQEPVSAVYASVQQDRLGTNLAQLERRQVSALERRALAQLGSNERQMAFLARQLGRSAKTGSAIGRIKIPAIGADYVVVQGTSESALEKGPGRYPGQPLPGQSGTVAIAGHRTTYLAPFRKVDELRRGDRVVLEMPYGEFTYRVLEQRIVEPTDLGVLRTVHGPGGRIQDRLVLTACHPLYSAAQRIVIFAEQVAATPRGAALVGG